MELCLPVDKKSIGFINYTLKIVPITMVLNRTGGKILYFMLRQKFLTPGIRPYQSENLYGQLEEWERIRKEVRFLEEKAKGRSKKADTGKK